MNTALFLYIIGVSKFDPSGTKRNVHCRIYSTKPDPTAKENPNGVSVTEFGFLVEEANATEWVVRTGKFADMSVLDFV